ncbi:hypothetical protein [Rubellimicrobium arenae]|uniref:hypothetical protein n=1 Tax=Rubellimicrobium arenae TaxID=2817372 RepID=UPI001B3110B8|nr:hypothetical protein [Rubellimicrobium arenae]
MADGGYTPHTEADARAVLMRVTASSPLREFLACYDRADLSGFRALTESRIAEAEEAAAEMECHGRAVAAELLQSIAYLREV